MNFKKLAFWTTLFTTAAVPLATAQNPVILQGNYISNVFGQSNFILNPNAQTNVANVTVSSATVTRSTTTPLVATSEFNVTTSTSTGYADWSTRTFDAGMKGQNCEARFSYRGFSVGSTSVQIRQGSNTVAQLTLTPSTDPRIASINFPCGDLSAATTLRVQQATASLTGTNEIGGIYVGLATNMANVAQAELYGTVTMAACSSPWTTSGSGSQWESFPTRTSCTYSPTGKASAPSTNIPAIQFSNLPAGEYQIVLSGAFGRNAAQTGAVYFRARTTDGTFTSNPAIVATTTTAQNQYAPTATFYLNITSGGTRTIEIQGYNNSSSTAAILGVGTPDTTQIAVYRFPTSSELVVTPERQNVWGGVVHDDANQSLFFGIPASSTFSSYNNAAWNKPVKLKGRAAVTTTNTGNDLGFSIDQLPVGNYKLNLTNGFYAAAGLTDGNEVSCTFQIRETITNRVVGRTVLYSARFSSFRVSQDGFGVIEGVFTQTSVGQRNFILEAAKTADTNVSSQGQCVAMANSSLTANILSFTITPLDQPSNSALYVQGPVLGAQTGAAIPAGYVGEITRAATSSSNITNSGSWNNNIGSLVLPSPGVYSISASTIIDRNGATFSSAGYFIISMSNTNNNDNSVYPWQRQGNGVESIGISTSFFQYSLKTRELIIRYDGTSIIWPNGSSTTGATVYLQGYISAFTAGTVLARYVEMVAVRIN